MVKIKDGFKGERSIILPQVIIEELKEGTITRELFITDIGYYPKAKYHYRERNNNESKQFILIYCVEGEGWFRLNGRESIIQPNQFFIIPKGKAHSYGSSKNNPWTLFWLHFDGEHASFFARGFDKATDISPNRNSRIEDRINLFEEIFISLSNGYSKNNLLYITTSLFHFLGSMKFIGEYRENSKFGMQSDDTMDLIIHHMRENIGNKFTLKNFADHAKVSVSHFSLLFFNKTGYSPMKYFIQLKMQKACHLLDYSDLHVNQISPLVGFEDAFYFTRMFKKTMGVSPTEYRTRKKG